MGERITHYLNYAKANIKDLTVLVEMYTADGIKQAKINGETAIKMSKNLITRIGINITILFTQKHSKTNYREEKNGNQCDLKIYHLRSIDQLIRLRIIKS